MSDQAIKLFEALSDVDEELLERCNREKNKVIYMPLGKYKRAMTACVCLLVVGVLSWGGYQLIGGRKGSAGSGSDSAAPVQIQDMAEPMETRAGASEEDFAASGANTSQYAEPVKEGIGDDQTQTTAEREQNDNIVDSADRFSEQKRNDAASSVGGTSPESDAIDNLQGSTSNNFATGKSEAQMDKEMESTLLDSRTEVPWNTACKAEPFGSYLPTVIPAGYKPLSARQSSVPDEWNNMIFKWGNGEQMLYLNMTVGEAKTKDEIKAEIQKSDGLYQYLAEDFIKDMIPDPIDGEISFTLYYTDGMEINFFGSITEDEMWELVKSISR